jgi:Uma2 family endonuclease
MGTSLLVSEQEYLATSYEPDCEYDEGVLLERNLGEQPHSFLETAFGSFFFERRKRFRIRTLTEQRIRIAPRKYRIPDICVYLQPVPEDPVLSTPPFIAIEILSPEDRTATSIYEAKHGILRTENPAIEVPLAELFQALDD